MTFLGLHDEVESTSYTPSFRSENKRRILAHAFILDKILVAFTGRPPLLSRRYCSTPLPLDLSEEDLLAGGGTLAVAVETLDEKGWNTQGTVTSATLHRARVVVAFLKDEILEIALNRRATTTIDHLLSVNIP